MSASAEQQTVTGQHHHDDSQNQSFVEVEIELKRKNDLILELTDLARSRYEEIQNLNHQLEEVQTVNGGPGPGESENSIGQQLPQRQIKSRIPSGPRPSPKEAGQSQVINSSTSNTNTQNTQQITQQNSTQQQNSVSTTTNQVLTSTIGPKQYFSQQAQGGNTNNYRTRRNTFGSYTTNTIGSNRSSVQAQQQSGLGSAGQVQLQQQYTNQNQQQNQMRKNQYPGPLSSPRMSVKQQIDALNKELTKVKTEKLHVEDNLRLSLQESKRKLDIQQQRYQEQLATQNQQHEETKSNLSQAQRDLSDVRNLYTSLETKVQQMNAVGAELRVQYRQELDKIKTESAAEILQIEEKHRQTASAQEKLLQERVREAVRGSGETNEQLLKVIEELETRLRESENSYEDKIREIRGQRERDTEEKIAALEHSKIELELQKGELQDTIRSAEQRNVELEDAVKLAISRLETYEDEAQKKKQEELIKAQKEAAEKAEKEEERKLSEELKKLQEEKSKMDQEMADAIEKARIEKEEIAQRKILEERMKIREEALEKREEKVLEQDERIRQKILDFAKAKEALESRESALRIKEMTLAAAQSGQVAKTASDMIENLRTNESKEKEKESESVVSQTSQSQQDSSELLLQKATVELDERAEKLQIFEEKLLEKERQLEIKEKLMDQFCSSDKNQIQNEDDEEQDPSDDVKQQNLIEERLHNITIKENELNQLKEEIETKKQEVDQHQIFLQEKMDLAAEELRKREDTWEFQEKMLREELQRKLTAVVEKESFLEEFEKTLIVKEGEVNEKNEQVRTYLPIVKEGEVNEKNEQLTLDTESLFEKEKSHTTEVKNAEEEFKKWEERLNVRDKQIQEESERLNLRHKKISEELEDKEGILFERERFVEQQAKDIQDRNDQLIKRIQEIESRETGVAKAIEDIENRNVEIEQRNSELDIRVDALGKRETKLFGREHSLDTRELELKTKEDSIKHEEQQLKSRENELKIEKEQFENSLKQREQRLSAIEETWKTRDNDQIQRENDLTCREEDLKHRDITITVRENDLQHRERLAEMAKKLEHAAENVYGYQNPSEIGCGGTSVGADGRSCLSYGGQNDSKLTDNQSQSQSCLSHRGRADSNLSVQPQQVNEFQNSNLADEISHDSIAANAGDSLIEKSTAIPFLFNTEYNYDSSKEPTLPTQMNQMQPDGDLEDNDNCYFQNISNHNSVSIGPSGKEENNNATASFNASHSHSENGTAQATHQKIQPVSVSTKQNSAGSPRSARSCGSGAQQSAPSFGGPSPIDIVKQQPLVKPANSSIKTKNDVMLYLNQERTKLQKQLQKELADEIANREQLLRLEMRQFEEASFNKLEEYLCQIKSLEASNLSLKWQLQSTSLSASSPAVCPVNGPGNSSTGGPLSSSTITGCELPLQTPIMSTVGNNTQNTSNINNYTFNNNSTIGSSSSQQQYSQYYGIPNGTKQSSQQSFSANSSKNVDHGTEFSSKSSADHGAVTANLIVPECYKQSEATTSTTTYKTMLNHGVGGASTTFNNNTNGNQTQQYQSISSDQQNLNNLDQSDTNLKDSHLDNNNLSKSSMISNSAQDHNEDSSQSGLTYTAMTDMNIHRGANNSNQYLYSNVNNISASINLSNSVNNYSNTIIPGPGQQYPGVPSPIQVPNKDATTSKGSISQSQPSTIIDLTRRSWEENSTSPNRKTVNYNLMNSNSATASNQNNSFYNYTAQSFNYQNLKSQSHSQSQSDSQTWTQQQSQNTSINNFQPPLRSNLPLDNRHEVNLNRGEDDLDITGKINVTNNKATASNAPKIASNTGTVTIQNNSGNFQNLTTALSNNSHGSQNNNFAQGSGPDVSTTGRLMVQLPHFQSLLPKGLQQSFATKKLPSSKK